MAANKRIIITVAIVFIIAVLGSLLILSGVISLSGSSGPKCVVSGCSGELCVDSTDNSSSGISICIWSNKYACYKTAKCEVQSNGKCGWTATSTLNACLSQAQ